MSNFDKAIQALKKALTECLKRATIPSSEVAKELGGNAEYTKNKLLDLKKRGLIRGEIVSGMWCFALKQ